ncbi:fatty acid desaturase family protein [Candidatus Cyanaurora vandensis]|uniref:fatty acid desaturase family protein n=1 Tax=Candidatus Cyanaurora vandensis TaxID=2714958 RepID=UPI00258025D0|nr:fatty acid desaturase family protein [Candidatus Cyanaurora vandensis]
MSNREPSILARSSQLLSPSELQILNARSNWRGTGQLAGHLAVLGVSGYLWATYWALPALIIYGFSLAAMFATVHECVHRTAFADNRLNDVVAWGAGLLSFYNSTFYRRYHKWHHRFTQIPGKDPELSDPKPTNLWEYLIEISGLTWWWGKVRGHGRVALGQLADCPFIPDTARQEVINSVRWQLAVYLAAITISLVAQQPWFLLYWLVPLAVGQPILRGILLAEHTGCTQDDNPLTNTRTTLTNWPVRFLMWNMPFHAEHHLYPSLPFHALPAAHPKLKPHLTRVAPGYLQVNQTLVTKISPR